MYCNNSEADNALYQQATPFGDKRQISGEHFP